MADYELKCDLINFILDVHDLMQYTDQIVNIFSMKQSDFATLGRWVFTESVRWQFIFAP